MKVKAILVHGDMVTRGVQRVSTLPEKIESALNDFSASLDGKIVDIKSNVDFGSAASAGSALLLVSYDGNIDSKTTSKKK